MKGEKQKVQVVYLEWEKDTNSILVKDIHTIGCYIPGADYNETIQALKNAGFVIRDTIPLDEFE